MSQAQERTIKQQQNTIHNYEKSTSEQRVDLEGLRLRIAHLEQELDHYKRFVELLRTWVKGGYFLKKYIARQTHKFCEERGLGQ